MHTRPIQERIAWLFDLARRHSADFAGPEAFLARKRYLATHPTAIMVLKCMDGRINLAVATRTPMGIIQPFRNLGGMFNLGWPHLGEMLTGHVMDVVSAGRRALILITYHFSRGDARRGCAGFGFDTQAAIAHVLEVKAQVEYTFGAAHGTVYPIVCGFETDEDALILHGADGLRLDASEPGSHSVGSRPQMASPAAMDVGGPAAGNAESYEVDAAVRNWAWETRSPERKPTGSYDFEELWLAR